ncbi:MAG: hypothetical protein ACOC7S_00760 [Planctomycetota bacterium]
MRFDVVEVLDTAPTPDRKRVVGLLELRLDDGSPAWGIEAYTPPSSTETVEDAVTLGAVFRTQAQAATVWRLLTNDRCCVYVGGRLSDVHLQIVGKALTDIGERDE